MLKNTKKRLLIFDLDGTLADTLPSITRAINLCAKHFGYPEKDAETVRRAVGNGVNSLLQKTMPAEAVEDSESFERIKKYFAECYELTQASVDSCYEGVGEAVRSFFEMGYIIAILSNKPDNLVKMISKNLFPDGIIAKSVGQTDMPKKPDPTVPLMIASELSISPENTYFIGDSEVDVLTGKNAGMVTVAVSWGFRARSVLEAAEPDFIIDTPSELKTLFGAGALE